MTREVLPDGRVVERVKPAPGRWALIFATEGREEVISIQEREGGAPALPTRLRAPAAANYRYERVPLGVEIGMVVGGNVRAVGRFGYLREDAR